MQKNVPIALVVAFCMFSAACDQSTVHYPEDSNNGGSCGAWYPGLGQAENGFGYSAKEGDLFPCLVWESVAKDGQNTWLNVGDLYLAAKHGEVSARALVVVKVGISCAGCHDLVVELSEVKEMLAPSAVMVALTHGDAVYPDVYPLEEAVEVIVDEEGWPMDWYLTNDVENHFSDNQFVGVPWITVVDLETMEVLSSSNQVFSATNVDDLIELVEGI